jgi:hypothetical protein
MLHKNVLSQFDFGKQIIRSSSTKNKLDVKHCANVLQFNRSLEIINHVLIYSTKCNYTSINYYSEHV